MPPVEMPSATPVDLTGVVAGLSAVTTAVNIFITEFREHRAKNELHWRDSTVVIGSLNTSITGLGEKVATLTRKIEVDLEPRVNGHSTQFSEIAGGLKFGRMVWIAIGGCSGAMGIIGYLAARAFH